MLTILRAAGAVAIAGAFISLAMPAQSQEIRVSNTTSWHVNDAPWGSRWHEDHWFGYPGQYAPPHHYPRNSFHPGGSVSFSINVSVRVGSWAAHVRRCEDRFMTYDRDTDMYVGSDYRRHRCGL
jgi:hypothetical protein